MNFYDDMPTLEFMFDGQTEPVKIEPWVYTINEMEDENGEKSPPCTALVSFSPFSMNTVLLGDSFLRQYVTSFNYTDHTITLGKNKHSPTKPLTINDVMNYLKIVLIVGLLVIIVIVGICIWCCCRAKNRRNAASAASSHYQTQAAT